MIKLSKKDKEYIPKKYQEDVELLKAFLDGIYVGLEKARKIYREGDKDAKVQS